MYIFILTGSYEREIILLY